MAAADAADFQFDGIETLLYITADFLDQLRNSLAFAVISTGDVDRNGVAVAAEEFVEWQARGLGHDVVDRGVHWRHRADHAVFGPAAHRRFAAIGGGEHLFPYASHHERIFADHERAKTFAKQIGA